MGVHDEYAKRVLSAATNGTADQYGPALEVDFGAGSPGRIDGAVGGQVAVEAESRTSKQVRGAVLDLICHPYPKKLLLVLPVHMHDPDVTARQCEHILARFVPRESFRVVLLHGSGSDPKVREDAGLVSRALAELGYKPPEIGERVAETSPMVKTRSQAARSVSNWDALRQHLRALPASVEELQLTFGELEKLLGFPLPRAARDHRAWWANQRKDANRPQARAWQSAGFRVTKVDQRAVEPWVLFVRR